MAQKPSLCLTLKTSCKKSDPVQIGGNVIHIGAVNISWKYLQVWDLLELHTGDILVCWLWRPPQQNMEDIWVRLVWDPPELHTYVLEDAQEDLEVAESNTRDATDSFGGVIIFIGVCAIICAILGLLCVFVRVRTSVH